MESAMFLQFHFHNEKNVNENNENFDSERIFGHFLKNRKTPKTRRRIRMTATTSRSRGLRRRERPRGRELGRADSKHLKQVSTVLLSSQMMF